MYTVYIMRKLSRTGSVVLTIRVPPSLDRKLGQEARRRRQSRSHAARALLELALRDHEDADPAAEARRQSRAVAVRESEADVLDFITTAADLRGWK